MHLAVALAPCIWRGQPPNTPPHSPFHKFTLSPPQSRPEPARAGGAARRGPEECRTPSCKLVDAFRPLLLVSLSLLPRTRPPPPPWDRRSHVAADASPIPPGCSCRHPRAQREHRGRPPRAHLRVAPRGDARLLASGEYEPLPSIVPRARLPLAAPARRIPSRCSRACRSRIPWTRGDASCHRTTRTCLSSGAVAEVVFVNLGRESLNCTFLKKKQIPAASLRYVKKLL